LWIWKFNKSIQVKEMQTIFDFHTSKMFHEWYVFQILPLV
jgi:hypothetical protein